MSEQAPGLGERLGRLMERTIAVGGWLMAPIYVGMTVMLALITVKFIQELLAAIPPVLRTTDSHLILTALSLIDLALVANLVMVAALSGYNGLVSRIIGLPVSTRFVGMGTFDLGAMKLRLISAIVGISSIRLLESFIYPGQRPDRAILWQVVIQLVIVVSGLMLVLIDRLALVGKRDDH